MIDRCYIGDTRDGLRALISASVKAQTCVTSPPYWGLRDYGVPGQLGLEPTIAEYVANMVEVFRLVRDVLADDGTLWLNLGDSYCSTAPGTRGDAINQRGILAAVSDRRAEASRKMRPETPDGLKPKDLCGIPWRVAFALQADGWYLRQDIIWSKPNPMPESVTDRCTKSHEYIFLLSKRERYYFDAAAIAEPSVTNDMRRPYGSQGAWDVDGRPDEQKHGGEQRTKRDSFKRDGSKREQTIPGQSYGTHRPNREESNWDVETRNRRSVWTVTTQPYSEAHFATFPPKLIEPCILAGSRVGDVVLDPFMGSGTVGQVAQQLGRRWTGCEINGEYVKMQSQRTAQGGLHLHA